MARPILIVLGVALLSACGFGLVMLLVWFVARMVLGIFPYVLEYRFQAMMGVLPVLCLLASLVGAGCAASALAARRRTNRAPRNLTLHHRFRG